MPWNVSRRAFLKDGSLAALAIGGGASSLVCRLAQTTEASGRTLVHVFLRGGVDGLSVLIPHDDPAYYDARGEIAIPKPGQDGGAVPLADGFGLHPALSPLKKLFADGKMAFVNSVGNYDVSRSHFSAQDFVETGTPGVRTTKTGVLSRATARLSGDSVTKAIALSPNRPVSFMGPDPVLVALSLEDFALSSVPWKDEAAAHLAAMYEGNEAGPTVGCILDALKTLRTTPALLAAPSNGAVYPDSEFGQSMAHAAQIVRAGVGARCIFVHGFGVYDTHSAQLEHHARDFVSLGRALAAFDQDIGARRDDVVVLVTTEFGRTVLANGSLGTDHGSGYCAMVMGGGVRGGRLHGEWKGLAKDILFEGRDVPVRTDFRDLFAEVAHRHLALESGAELFPNYTPKPVPGLFV